MKIRINGDLPVNRYYIQSLCMLFFPGEKFSDKESETNEPRLELNVAKSDGRIRVDAVLNDGISSETGISELEFVANGLERTVKLACGYAICEAGKKLTGVTPSFGMLVGIRPAKLVRELLMTGKTPFAVRKILRKEYLVNPKKATLCIDVAQNEQAVLERYGMDTCSLYISIPFCPTRCAYCSFVSYSTERLKSLIPEYLGRLCRDIERTAQRIKRLGMRLVTIYIGGGTPTILDDDQLKLLLSTVNACFDVSKLDEFTLESGRPDTVTDEKMMIAKAFGVTRVSVNPQTLNDNILDNIGRRHTSADFFAAFESARRAGIGTINCDLIAGLPGESYPSFSKSIDGVLALEPENVTVHTFCVKKSAEFRQTEPGIYRRKSRETEKSVDYSQLRMKISGYLPYYMYRQKNTVGNLENVGFTLEGHAGIYNVLIMEENHTIFAVGAGAVTKFVKYNDAGIKQIERVFEPKYPFEYLRQNEFEDDLRLEQAAGRFFGEK